MGSRLSHDGNVLRRDESCEELLRVPPAEFEEADKSRVVRCPSWKSSPVQQGSARWRFLRCDLSPPLAMPPSGIARRITLPYSLVPSVRFGANDSTDSFFDFIVANAGGTLAFDFLAFDFRFQFMKRWIFVLLLCVAYAGTLLLRQPARTTALRGEPFERAEVTRTVNLVSLLPQATRAVPGDVIKGDSALKTGLDSRAELQFSDLTITRVGSNSLFRFVARQGAGRGHHRGGIGLSDFGYRRKGQGDLPESQGPGLFYGESQDPRCATPRTDG
jgi:hypothetical protein